MTTPAPMSRSRTIGTFALTTLLSGGVSILSIPLIVILTDAQAWGSIALGQAVGSSVGVLAMFGWGVTGPATVAMMPAARHAAAYWESIMARLLLMVPALAITIITTMLLVPTEPLASVACAIAMAFGGLSGSWFTVGVKRPDKLFLLDSLPRVVGTVLGIVALALGGSLVAFGALQLLGSLAAFVLVTGWAVPGFRRPAGAARGFRATVRVLVEQRHGVVVAVAIAAYYPVVLALVAAFAPLALPLYALIEKVLRFAVMAMQPVFQYFQATVPAHRGRALARAIRQSLLVATVLALICWAGFALLLPVASLILTDGQVSVPTLVSVNLGAYMGAIVLTTVLSSVALIAVDRVRSVGWGGVVCSVLGLGAVLVFAIIGDGADISWGFVVTAIMLLAFQVVVLVRALPLKVAQQEAEDAAAPARDDAEAR